MADVQPSGIDSANGGYIAASKGVTASGDTTGATDGAAIQAAIDSLKGTWGTVQLKGAQFYTNQTINTYPGIKLVGEGPLGVTSPAYGSSIITGVAALNAPIIQILVDSGNTGAASFPVLQDLTINGVSTNSLQDGIYITDTAGQVLDAYILNVNVFNVGGNGLNLSDVNGKIWVDKCYFEHCFQNGIRNQNSTLRVTQCYIFGCTLYGIDATSCAYLMAAHNLFGNNGQSGTANAAGAIKMGSSGSGGSITSNDFFDNGTSSGQAIRVTTQTGTGRWIIASNNFKDTRGGSAVPNFVLLGDSGACNAIVSGNMCVGSASSAVRMRFNNASEATQIRGNHGFNPVGLITNPLSTANNSIGLTGLSTTATGVNALNSATINCGSTTGFPASGNALLGGVAFTYTGVTATSFTGCGNHAATTGGETIAPCLVASTDYTIREVDQDIVISGGTSVAIIVKDNLGNQVNPSALATLDRFMPIGWKFNAGAFTGTPPTLASYGN